MTGRRGKGEGSIYKRQDGRWSGSVDLGWEGGKRQRKTVYGRTRQEVAHKLNDLLKAKRDGLPVRNDRLRTSAFLETWLHTVQPTLREKTWKGYEQLVRTHAIPALGNVPISRLSPTHLQKLYADTLQSGRSATTAAHLHAVLHRALGQAARWGVVPRNVAELVDAPSIQRKEMRTLAPQEARHFLDVAASDRLHALYVVALSTGLRQGELLALRWADVDLEKRTLQIRGSLQRTSSGLTVTETKTSKSRRSVMLPEVAIDALKTHRAKQGIERLAQGPDWPALDLIFCNKVGRPIESQNLLARGFRPLLKRAGLPTMRFHDLRHTAATLLLGEGVHPKIVSEMLGHSQVSVTLDIYSHVTPTMQAQAAAAMESVLGRSS